MRHVHVITENTHFEYDRLWLTENALVSLINTIQVSLKDQKGLPLHKSLGLVREYKEKLIDTVPNAKLYLDSGGYSIMKGDVPFDKILSFIDEYHDFMAKNVDYFDYIFSLDIPFGFYKDDIKDEDKKLQHYDVIYNLNKISLQKTIDLLKARPELKEKFYFIQQFKLSDQFEIWNQLEEELNINDHIIHRSIGGLVGLKKMVRHFKRTTFLPMIFRSFYNFVEVYENSLQAQSLDFDIANRPFWRIGLKKLYSRINQISHYSGLKPSEKTDICEQLISNSDLKNHIQGDQFEELTGILKTILDLYFNHKGGQELFEDIINRVFDIDDPIKKTKKQVAASASDKKEFRLHVLGVSNLQDRYIIALVEKLLNNHCISEGLPIKIHITYDSIFYSNQAMKNFKRLNYFMDDWNWYSLKEVPERYLDQVYLDKSDLVKEERKRALVSENLISSSTFAPLNIYSHLNLDQYLEDIVSNTGGLANALVKTLSDATDGSKVVSELFSLFNKEIEFLATLAKDASEPVINRRIAMRLNDDIRTIIHYYLLIRQKADLSVINDQIKKYVTEIDFPFEGFM
jgi:hypothetical protein